MDVDEVEEEKGFQAFSGNAVLCCDMLCCVRHRSSPSQSRHTKSRRSGAAQWRQQRATRHACMAHERIRVQQ